MLSPKHPFYSANDFFREKFNNKLIKIAVDGGFTCPNRDGSLSYAGCIFCSNKGSGDFAGSRRDSIVQQIQKGKEQMSRKWNTGLYMAYFQSYTNTYADIEYLKGVYTQAIEQPDIVALSIATRPDCIDEKVVELLKKLSERVYVCVELGLQTINDKTVKLINRCYENEVYIKAMNMLNKADIDTVTHTIIGLPGENFDDYINTINFAVDNGTKGLKLQLLHVLEGTRLCDLYKEKGFYVYDLDTYVKTVVDLIERIPENIVIHRITGDGAKDILVAPRFTLDKRLVLNSIHKEFVRRGSFQGIYRQN